MNKDKKQKAEAVSTLIRLGWSPPPPSSPVALRIVEDIVKIGGSTSTNELSPQEFRILVFLAEGDTAEEIGDTLCRSTETIKGYVKKIRAKLGARNTAHAVSIAYQEGLLHVETARDAA